MIANTKQVFTTAIAAIMLFLSVAYAACKKTSSAPAPDACVNVSCKNGSTCFQGLCSCPNGYEESDCGKRSMDRFEGTWDVEETIMGSSHTPNKGKKTKYMMDIAPVQNEPVRFVMKNLMGKGSENISAELGQKYNAVTKAFEKDVTTNFAMRPNQAMNGTYIIVQGGNGRVNDFGNTMIGTYYIVYPTDSIVVNDTISFTATYIK